MNFEKQQMLADLLMQLDDVNEGIQQCIETLKENAEITRRVIRELMDSPVEQDPTLKPSLSSLFQPEEKPSEDGKPEELNIFDEDFEKMIEEKNEKVTSTITKNTFKGPLGNPIEVLEIKMGEDMTEEEIAKEITKHMKNIRKMFDPNAKDEGDDDEPIWS